jgi:hypothetical protein
MDVFLLDCCFNAVYKGLKFRKLTPRYTNQLRTMQHSAEFNKKFHRRLHAMQLNVKFNSKFSG